MTPKDFIKDYEKALAAQDWKFVSPLISDSACVIFSNGQINSGKDAVKQAYEYNFRKIKNEKYTIENVIWIKTEETFAIYLFDYFWTGIVNGELLSGNGIGTTVILKEGTKWKLLSEHLGKKQVS